MARILSAFIAGALFGLGLVVSQMINPEKVLGFLTLGPGWDPSLALVMGGALAVAAPGYALVRRARARPLFEPRYFIPASGVIDPRLVIGGVLFGAGWGLSGLCPGPAIAAIGVGSPLVWLFAAAMAAGTLIAERPLAGGRTAPPTEEGATSRG